MKFIVAIYGSLLSNDRLSGVLADTWAWAIRESTRLRVPVTHFGAEFGDPVVDLKQGKTYTVARRGEAVLREMDRGNVTTVEMVSRVTRPKGYLAVDWDWMANFGQDEKYGSIVVVGVDCGVPGFVPTENIDRLVRRAVSLWPMSYGFAAVMQDAVMPGGYAIGLACGSDDIVIEDANAWTATGRARCKSVLRNVYGYNVLNRDHLELAVGTRSLQDWISQADYRGRIELLDNRLYTWTIGRGGEEAFLSWDCAGVQKVRVELMALNMFPWRTDHVPGE